MTWSEDAFWRCSWRGFADAWAGYSRFVLGIEPGREDLTRPEAEALDDAVRAWQRQEQSQDRRP